MATGFGGSALVPMNYRKKMNEAAERRKAGLSANPADYKEITNRIQNPPIVQAANRAEQKRELEAKPAGAQVGARDTVEKLGGTVTWNPDKRVLLISGKGGSFEMKPDALVNGKAFISADRAGTVTRTFDYWNRGSDGGSAPKPPVVTPKSTPAYEQPGFNLGDYTKNAIVGAVKAGSPNAWASPELMGSSSRAPLVTPPSKGSGSVGGTAAVSTAAPTAPTTDTAGLTNTDQVNATDTNQQETVTDSTTDKTGLVRDAQEKQPPEDVTKKATGLRRAYEEVASSGPDGMAIAAYMANQALALIDRQAQEITAAFQNQMANLDPATMAALGALKDTVTEQRNRLMDEMNRRGLLQSGIWLQMEDKINKNELNAQQQMLATRLTNLQNQMLSSLQSFAQMRIQATQQYNMAGLQAVESQASRQQQAALAGLRAEQEQGQFNTRQASEMQRWQAEQDQAYQKWTAEFNQKYADQYAKFTGTIPQGFTGAGQPTYEAQQAEANRAAKLREAQLKTSSSSPYTSSGYYSDYPGITPAVEQELGMSKEQITQGARSAGVTNTQYVSAVKEAKAIDKELNDALSAMQSGSGWMTLADIENNIRSSASALRAAGIDPEAYLRQAISKYTTILHSMGR